jgi:hypothetical protein
MFKEVGSSTEEVLGIASNLIYYKEASKGPFSIFSECSAANIEGEFQSKLIGVLKGHMLDCKKPKCFCKESGGMNSKEIYSLPGLGEIVLNGYIKYLLELGLNSAPESVDLRIHLANHLFTPMD